MFDDRANANAHTFDHTFAVGQSVIADGRPATYAGAFAGAHYVHTIAGIVRARAIAPTDYGAARQLQAGASRAGRRSHVSLVPSIPRRVAYCLPRAA